MNSILSLLASTPVSIALGWTLVHFIWQAAVIGLAAWAILQFMRSRTAHSRYLVLSSGLIMMMLAPIITLVVFLSTGESDVAIHTPYAAQPTDSASEQQPVSVQSVNGPIVLNHADVTPPTQRSRQDVQPGSVPTRQSRLTAWSESMLSKSDVFLPWCVWLWMVGVLLLAIRLTFGFNRVKRWRQGAVPVGDHQLNLTFEKLRHVMLIRPVVQIMQSTQVLVPTVIGWLKPIVLLPVSLISELTTEELESILAHELAHIRRHDYLVNLVQIVAETGLFYHPAVWWISNQIRIERENCCDDVAVSVCGSRLVFASALTRIETLRHLPDRSTDRLVVAADGGSLVARIRRLTLSEPGLAPRWPAGLVTLMALTIAAGSFAVSGATAPREHSIVPESNEITPQTLADNPLPDSDPDTLPTSASDDYPTRIGEVTKVDSKTGLEKRVYPNIKLVSGETTPTKTVQLEMMYSNVMRYTFIPERIAKALGAVPLGEIDFGEQAPPKRQIFQTGIDTPKPSVQPQSADQATTEKTITVDQLKQPTGKPKIVPYEFETIWVPGHLEFYGMNQTHQHKFQVVRIDSIDIGLPAGPLNVLVLDDENSDFGLLGKDTIARVAGKQGESLWWHANGTFQLVPTQKPAQRLVNQEEMATKPLTDTPPEGRPPILPPPPVRVTWTGSHSWDLDLHFLSPDIKRLKTLNYAMGSRVSTDWVLVDGVRKPVDKGIEQDGIVVYVTLFGEVIAVDAETKQVQWRIPWGKMQPMWKTISVVELDVDDQKKLAIELFATKNKERELIFNYVDLKTGEPIDSYNFPPQAQPAPSENEHPSPQTDDGPGDTAPKKGAGKQADDVTDQKPWSVQGRVTDVDGKPIKGALIRAHCGIGTLQQSGSASTDSNGEYAFRFGPGIWPTDGKDLIQAATISVSYPGHFEKNLHRQGDLVAGFHVPNGQIGWGDKTIDDVFLPGKPKTIDFVMVPATHVTGFVVVSKNGKRPSGMRISLKGKEMPPSSSVVAHTTTDENGRFEFTNIPTGFSYQILVEPAKAEPPWLAWASPAITFVKGNSGNTHIEHSIDGTESDFSFAQLVVFINGDGVNWKTALKTAANKKLELTWDGISTLNNKIVAARSAFLEIGD